MPGVVPGMMRCGELLRRRHHRVGAERQAFFDRQRRIERPFVPGESDKADDRMRKLAIAHKTIVIDRLTALCTEAGIKQPTEIAHTLGLVIDGAIVMAPVTRDAGAADVAGRACAAILPK